VKVEKKWLIVYRTAQDFLSIPPHKSFPPDISTSHNTANTHWEILIQLPLDSSSPIANNTAPFLRTAQSILQGGTFKGIHHPSQFFKMTNLPSQLSYDDEWRPLQIRFSLRMTQLQPLSRGYTPPTYQLCPTSSLRPLPKFTMSISLITLSILLQIQQIDYQWKALDKMHSLNHFPPIHKYKIASKISNPTITPLLPIGL